MYFDKYLKELKFQQYALTIVFLKRTKKQNPQSPKRPRVLIFSKKDLLQIQIRI